MVIFCLYILYVFKRFKRTSDDSFGSEESRAVSEPESDDKWPKEIASARARTAHNSHQMEILLKNYFNFIKKGS